MSPSARAVVSRPRTYLIAKNDEISPAGAGPLEFDWVVEQLRADPAVRVERVLGPRALALQQAGPEIVREVVVAALPEPTADQLRQHPQVVLEEDHPLVPVADDPALVSPFGTTGQWRIEVRSPTGAPVEGATVFLYGRGIPAQARTDATGTVELSLLNETDQTLRALYVNPQRDYWTLWVDRPALVTGATNTVTLQALGDSFPGFPRGQLVGWGQQAMRLTAVPAALDGRGVRVAVVDSGAAATTHPDLAGIREGVDLTAGEPNTVHWIDDTLAHGSHCCGVVAGADDPAGIRGFAPGATVLAARIFPGGRLSSLLDALDHCIAEQVDVVNLSLGTGGTSQVVLQKLAQARQAGVACIVAAGNSGDAVQFPGLSPDVLTVAAVGRDGVFPDSSYHAQQRLPGGRTDRGFFAAKFSCHGPEIDVCAPGVAIVSSVPPDGFAAWDGTSMATPHVTGLAALVLAHHPDFRTPGLRLRTAARVDRLFEILRASATPLDLGDPTRTGAGMPDAVRALALDRPVAPVPQDGAVRSALDGVLRQLVAAGLRRSEPVVATASDVRRRLAEVGAQLAAAGLS